MIKRNATELTYQQIIDKAGDLLMKNKNTIAVAESVTSGNSKKVNAQIDEPRAVQQFYTEQVFRCLIRL